MANFGNCPYFMWESALDLMGNSPSSYGNQPYLLWESALVHIEVNN